MSKMTWDEIAGKAMKLGLNPKRDYWQEIDYRMMLDELLERSKEMGNEVESKNE